MYIEYSKRDITRNFIFCHLERILKTVMSFQLNASHLFYKQAKLLYPMYASRSMNTAHAYTYELSVSDYFSGFFSTSFPGLSSCAPGKREERRKPWSGPATSE
jgi:hypothetical protein